MAEFGAREIVGAFCTAMGVDDWPALKWLPLGYLFPVSSSMQLTQLQGVERRESNEALCAVLLSEQAGRRLHRALMAK